MKQRDSARLKPLETDGCPFVNLPEPRNARRGLVIGGYIRGGRVFDALLVGYYVPSGVPEAPSVTVMPGSEMARRLASGSMRAGS